MSLASFFTGLMQSSVTPDAIRSEIYFLGSRHGGEALSGALSELRSADVAPDRARLLRAVVDQLQRR
jgi:hypothetical protein